MAFQLNKNNQNPTSEQTQILQSYAGFGGIKAILNPILDDSAWKTQIDIELRPILQQFYQIISENVMDKSISAWEVYFGLLIWITVKDTKILYFSKPIRQRKRLSNLR